MKRVDLFTRCEGRASHPHEGEYSKITTKDDGKVTSGGLILPCVVPQSFSFDHSLKYSYPYEYTLIVDELKTEGKIRCKNCYFTAFELAEFLYKEFGTNGFDIQYNGNWCKPNTRICMDSIIHISGFDEISAENRNRLMHALNGNMQPETRQEFIDRTHYDKYQDKVEYLVEQFPEVKVRNGNEVVSSRIQFLKLNSTSKIADEDLIHLWELCILPSLKNKVDQKAVNDKLKDIREAAIKLAKAGKPFKSVEWSKEDVELAHRIYSATYVPNPNNKDKKSKKFASKKEQGKKDSKASSKSIKDKHNRGEDVDDHKEVKVNVNKVFCEGEESGLSLDDSKDFGSYKEQLETDGELSDIDIELSEPKEEKKLGMLSILWKQKNYLYDVMYNNTTSSSPVIGLIEWMIRPVGYMAGILGASLAGVVMNITRGALVASSLTLSASPIKILAEGFKMNKGLLAYGSALIVIAMVCLRTKFSHIQRHEVDILTHTIEAQKTLTEKREYDNHFETTKLEHVCEFEETVTDRLRISLGPFSITLPYCWITTTHKTSLELVANMLSPINMNSTLSPLSVIERACKATNIGSFIDYDRAVNYDHDIIGGAERLVTAVVFHFRCATLQTSLTHQVFHNPEDKLVLLPTGTLVRTLASRSFLLTFVRQSFIAERIYTDTALKMLSLLPFPSLMRRLPVPTLIMNFMTNQSVHRWLIRVFSIYLLTRLVRTSLIPKVY